MEYNEIVAKFGCWDKSLLWGLIGVVSRGPSKSRPVRDQLVSVWVRLRLGQAKRPGEARTTSLLILGSGAFSFSGDPQNTILD